MSDGALSLVFNILKKYKGIEITFFCSHSSVGCIKFSYASVRYIRCFNLYTESIFLWEILSGLKCFLYELEKDYNEKYVLLMSNVKKEMLKEIRNKI